jgi:hypothetical protein
MRSAPTCPVHGGLPLHVGAWDLVRWSRATFKSINAKIEHGYDLAILISPDYELHQNQQVLDAMKPRLTLAMVHNADFANMSSLVGMREALELLSLSPHVAEALAGATGRKTDWLLPIYPVRPEPDCVAGPGSLMGMCLRGFAMQGKFSNLRRNYTSVWSQMTSKLDVLGDPQVTGKPSGPQSPWGSEGGHGEGEIYSRCGGCKKRGNEDLSAKAQRSVALSVALLGGPRGVTTAAEESQGAQGETTIDK